MKKRIINCLFFFYLAVVTVYGVKENTLSLLEEKAGYLLLFNGTDLNNWHRYKGDIVPPSWNVLHDGYLGTRIQNGAGEVKSILSDAAFQNFDLKLEWQCPRACNSGVFIRYQEEFPNETDMKSGPEAQIADSTYTSPAQTAGACYDMIPVADSLRGNWTKPAGQWNEFRIIAFDKHIAHYGNGKLLLSYEIGSPDFMAAYNKSKFSTDGSNGKYYELHKGSFMLQYRTTGDTAVAFRNLAVKDLGDSLNPFFFFKDGRWPEYLPQDTILVKAGCTDSLKQGYDSTARIDDGSCGLLAIQRVEKTSEPKLTMYSREGNLVITASMPLSFLSLQTLSGKHIRCKNMGPGYYMAEKESIRNGIGFLVFTTGGQTWKKKCVFRLSL
ncbi:MAG: DUF1080 domain-containing protein [Fibrobacteria bacterium]|nr:DUF1080 domain-containing protein [Fibrobacteria bacterium]